MAKTTQPGQSAVGAASDDLGVLIEAERELEARLDAIHQEAQSIVATAHAAAREAKRQLEAELGETAKRLRSQMEAEQKQKLLQIEQDSEREAAAFDVTGDDQVQTIAIRVAGLLLAKGTTAEMPDTGARR